MNDKTKVFSNTVSLDQKTIQPGDNYCYNYTYFIPIIVPNVRKKGFLTIILVRNVKKLFFIMKNEDSATKTTFLMILA